MDCGEEIIHRIRSRLSSTILHCKEDVVLPYYYNICAALRAKDNLRTNEQPLCQVTLGNKTADFYHCGSAGNSIFKRRSSAVYLQPVLNRFKKIKDN